MESTYQVESIGMKSKKTEIVHEHGECKKQMMPMHDALHVLSGRWKIPILLALSFGTRRFGQIKKDVGGITDKVLSKELREMETNRLITRQVFDTFPPTVEYSITEHGKTLRTVMGALADWGKKHRKKIIGREE